MGFNFSDSVYTALLGLFAAILGIGYPLIIQAMGEIDKRYNSTRLTSCFEKDGRFKRFNVAILVSVFAAFVSGFALHLFNGIACVQVVLLTVLSIVVLWLVISTISLYRLFMIFFYPQDLFEYLKSDQQPRLFEILDLTCYAAEKENVRLYNEGVKYIEGTIEQAKKNKYLTDYERGVVEEMLKRTSKKDAPRYLRIDSTAIFLYFSCRPLRFRMMWDVLRQHIENGNYDWIMNYWEIADQEFRDINKQHEKEDTEYPSLFCETDAWKDFKEFHIALGALLLYNKRNDWLRQMIRFTNTMPPSYDLALCTFRGVFRWLHYFAELPDIGKRSLEYKCPMNFHSGICTGGLTYHYIVRYLAYSMLYLDELNYNVRHVEPLELPVTLTEKNEDEKAILANKEFIRLTEILKQNVSEINKEINRPSKVVFEINSALDNFIENCETVIYNSIKEKKWSDEKEKRIKTQLVLEFNSQKEKLITDINSSLYKCAATEKTACVDRRIKESDIYEGDYWYCVNLESTIISSLIRNIEITFNQIFLLKDASKVYTIRYADIEEALDRLQLSDRYMVLGFGGVELERRFSTHLQAGIKDVWAKNAEIVVLKKSQMPYVEFCTSDKDTGFEQIEASCLYSNIGELKKAKFSEEKLILKVLVNYKLVVSQSPIKFIRLRVATEVTDKTYDLDKIVPANDVLQ